MVREPTKVENIWSTNKITGRYGDLVEPGTLVDICTGVDNMFHIAGFNASVEPVDTEDQDGHRRVIVEGTRALLSAAWQARVQQFVFISSVKVMGEGGDRCLDESRLTEPESAYGRAKLAADRLNMARGIEYGNTTFALLYWL